MAFSIITIVFNDVENILKTINSVISQTYKNIEYILIDGQSTDGTKEKILEILQSLGEITLLEENPSRLYLKGTLKQYPTLSFQFLSEKDQGIYDAMNKGIALANKDWINFMNCGDRFYTPEVLESLSRENLLDFDVVYGDTEIIYPQDNLKYILSSPNDPNKLYSLFRFFVHQSFFFKTNVHQKNLYDKYYKLAADYNTILSLYNQHYRFKHVDLILASFTANGISEKHKIRCLKEVFSIAKKYNNTFHKKIKIYSLFFVALIRAKIKTHFPSFAIFLLSKRYSQ